MNSLSNPNELQDFILDMKNKIKQSQQAVFRVANTELIKLYLEIGKSVSRSIEELKWGDSIVEMLAIELKTEFHNVRGFSARNIWRMKKFYELYKDHHYLEQYLYKITWSNHLHIMSKTKTIEEKEFYLALVSKERYSARDFVKIIDSCTFQRTMIANIKLSTVLAELPANRLLA